MCVHTLFLHHVGGTEDKKKGWEPLMQTKTIIFLKPYQADPQENSVSLVIQSSTCPIPWAQTLFQFESDNYGIIISLYSISLERPHHMITLSLRSLDPFPFSI